MSSFQEGDWRVRDDLVIQRQGRNRTALRSRAVNVTVMVPTFGVFCKQPFPSKPGDALSSAN